MTWHSVTVVRRDLDLMLGAIRWGGGTVTATCRAGEDVTITYVTAADAATPVPAAAGVL